jgi:hypothetical protein
MKNTSTHKYIHIVDYMDINVILTFSSLETSEVTQELFDVATNIYEDDDAVSFLHRELFGRLAYICDDLDCDIREIVKISTAANWSIFTKATNMPSLPDYGHCCKWWFALSEGEFSAWEKYLQRVYQIGASHR